MTMQLCPNGFREIDDRVCRRKIKHILERLNHFPFHLKYELSIGSY